MGIGVVPLEVVYGSFVQALKQVAAKNMKMADCHLVIEINSFILLEIQVEKLKKN